MKRCYFLVLFALWSVITSTIDDIDNTLDFTDAFLSNLVESDAYDQRCLNHLELPLPHNTLTSFVRRACDNRDTTYIRPLKHYEYIVYPRSLETILRSFANNNCLILLFSLHFARTSASFIASGSTHNCAVMSDGRNEMGNGQLGSNCVRTCALSTTIFNPAFLCNLFEFDAFDQQNLIYLESIPLSRTCHCDATVPNAHNADVVSTFLCDNRNTTSIRPRKHYQYVVYPRSLETILILFIVCTVIRLFANKKRLVLLFPLHFARISASSIAAGWTHNCAVISDEAKCWGNNLRGQLGYGDTNDRGDYEDEMGTDLPIIDLGSSFIPTQITAGSFHTCALSSINTVKCFGKNGYGQLGYGDQDWRGDGASEMGDSLPELELGTGFVPTQVAAGETHTCALAISTHDVKCWGSSNWGEGGGENYDTLGDEGNEMSDSLPYVDLGDFEPIQIATKFEHVCALSTTAVKCWGYNLDGQLGYGNEDHLGDGANEMGNDLPEVDLGTNPVFVPMQIATGELHTCALSTTNTVKCFGRNQEGQLGYGDIVYRGNGANEMGDNLPEVDLGANFEPMQIATGKRHTCALSTTNTVKCFGENNYGQLGYEDTDRRGDDSNEMGNHLPEVNLGSGFIPMQIVTGAYYTCVLSTLDKVKCWGANEDGQLGRGVYDPEAKGNEENEMGDYLLEIDLGSFTHPPTSAPTEPTRTPTSGPSGHPSSVPTLYPTTVPTAGPTVPTRVPTTAPTKDPSKNPTYVPTVHPTAAPTTDPSKYPTNAPIPPSQIPTDTPTLLPTTAPTTDPSKYPTDAPTAPSQYPSDTPTVHPTITPTKDPSKYPTDAPTIHPSATPSTNPSKYPTDTPTFHPTASPTTPTEYPTDTPTAASKYPTDAPTKQPSTAPTNYPSEYPTDVPTNVPTSAPSVSAETLKLNKAKSETNGLETTYRILSITVASSFGIMAVTAWGDSKYIRTNDYLKIGKILGMALQTLDMISDCFFAVNVSIQNRIDPAHLPLLILTICFIAIPALATVWQLQSHSHKYWLSSSDQVRGWLSKNNKMLFFVSLLIGNSFTAVTLVNSYVFQLDIFDMGLTEKQLNAFMNKRVWSVVLLENVPQFVLQIWFIVLSESGDPITITSMILSFVSIVVSVVSWRTQQKMSQTDRYVAISMKITGPAITSKTTNCKTLKRVLRKKLAVLIGVHDSVIEVIKPIQIQSGVALVVHFSFSSESDQKRKDYHQELIKANKTEALRELFKDSWVLSAKPDVHDIEIMEQTVVQSNAATATQLAEYQKETASDGPTEKQ